jgi:hypothetical protein
LSDWNKLTLRQVLQVCHEYGDAENYHIALELQLFRQLEV